MPQKEIDYSITCIYKIVCRDLEVKDFYIGHTTSFKHRKIQHKYDCQNLNSKKQNIYLYSFIKGNGGFDNFDMVFIESVCCKNVLEARQRERQLIEELKPSLNRTMPMIEPSVKEYKQNWYNENKERVSEEKKQKYQLEKEYVKQKSRDYHYKNRDIILEKMKEKTICECGSVVSKNHLNRHFSTLKHNEFINNK